MTIASDSAVALPFDNSYARLPEHFYARLQPQPVSAPELIASNRPLAEYLGIDPHWLESADGIATIAGNHFPQGAEPIATAYAGHQFGGWNPQLGDGRALLIGELLASDGARFDLQLKGSGPTPWSRGGDGRSPLGPVLREYLVSEAMATLGVPTTRALAAVSTGEQVWREQSEPGAILARVASSHIRFGTFQYFAGRGDTAALELLVKHVSARHFPEIAGNENLALAMFEAVLERVAKLVAKWQLFGFIHGVMNTDNMLLCGETIDYGPCAFMEQFDINTVFSSIDRQGRYAYGAQPGIAHWNLSCLVQTLLPLLDPQAETAVQLAQAALDRFPVVFQDAYNSGMRQKLGLQDSRDGDDELFADLLAMMTKQELDFTLCFRRLTELAAPADSTLAVTELLQLGDECEPWLQRWQQRQREDSASEQQSEQMMLAANPVFIPRNHLIAEVIHAAQHNADLKPFQQLLAALARPFSYSPELVHFATPARPEQAVQQTFCGT
ncbi:YdiU family protein [Halieaceae bacterium IMCC14734]|uniref:Protein nucleotidyltransferase YdiU n=1 Tax=Candidatus Litorirhabdus singularis TaxID=2518993 RepID=A0ABT3TG47_9GAMM|nr:YdiU family protein [Candidatus Litorirhabdus singularis]MCX2980399.1 YdiU family protein [Candidatus Litorirhabdus singularis]